jgi:Tfp pilus assembly protein PilF
LGLAYFKRDDLDLAIERFRKALSITPDKTEIHNNLGLIYLKKGDFAKAREEFQICLNDPTYGRVHVAEFNIGALEEAEGRVDKAEAIWLKVINSNQMPEAYFRVGQLALSRGDLKKAINYLSSATRLSPNYADAFYALARAYEAIGDNDEAAEAYGQVIRLSPNTPRAMEAQSRARRLLGFE